MPEQMIPMLQPAVIPGELIIRLSSEGRKQVNRSRPYVPFSGDVSNGMLEPAEGLGLGRIRKIFARHDLNVRIVRPLRPRAHAFTAGERAFAPTDFTPKERRRKLSDLYVLKTSEGVQGEDLFRLAMELRQEAGDIIETATPRRLAFTYQQAVSTHYFHQWALWRIGCEEAWDIQTGSEDVTVAVVDTGVEAHYDLQPNLLTGSDHVTANIKNTSLPAGWHFAPDPLRTDNSSHDEEKHGTHVAGIIGACGQLGYGVAGVVWNCKILPVRCMARIVNKSGYTTGVGHPDDIADAIFWAVDEGARVINASLGIAGVQDLDGTIIGDPLLEAAVQYARDAGCVVVAAVGNDGTRWPCYPANFPEVIGVGAVDWEDRRTSFSNWGEQVDVVAPGVNILSTVLGNDYAMGDGTSQASPHVAGLAAMLFSQYPQATPDQVAQAIRDSADKVSDSGHVDAAGKHLYYGWGRINARRALDELEKVVAS